MSSELSSVNKINSNTTLRHCVPEAFLNELRLKKYLLNLWFFCSHRDKAVMAIDWALKNIFIPDSPATELLFLWDIIIQKR